MASTTEDIPTDNQLAHTWRRFVSLLQVVQERLHLQEKQERMQQYAVDHPIQALVLTVLGITCSVPIGIFITFACCSLVITFIGFLCVEGFILIIGSIVLGGTICVVGFFGLGISFLIIAAASTVIGGRQLWTSYSVGLATRAMVETGRSWKRPWEMLRATPPAPPPSQPSAYESESYD